MRTGALKPGGAAESEAAGGPSRRGLVTQAVQSNAAIRRDMVCMGFVLALRRLGWVRCWLVGCALGRSVLERSVRARCGPYAKRCLSDCLQSGETISARCRG